MKNKIKNVHLYGDMPMCTPVFIGTSAIITILIATTLIIGQPIEKIFLTAQTYMVNQIGWLFIFCVNFFFLFSLYIAFSKFGKIRLGGSGCKPAFSFTGWIAMLFSAGMGIGLLYSGVAEPITHMFHHPLVQGVDQNTAAKIGLNYTIIHYGVHVWGIYCVVGLAFAFFAFNKKLPMSPRSIFYPLLGDRIYGWLGHVIDILAVTTTIIGLATSLGIGSEQITAGLNYLFNIPLGSITQIVVIFIATAIACLSLLLGLSKGVKKLSEINLQLALLLLLFIVIVGPTVFILKSIIQNTGYYISHFFEDCFWNESYISLTSNSNWQSSWTTFYWAWWISWSPFVGIFIAIISKGRTIKEFVLGVISVPTLFAIVWFTVFGGSGIAQELLGNHTLKLATEANYSMAIFKFLEEYPLALISSFLAIVLITSFFVTSSDSGSMVIDTITAGGHSNSPKKQKIFWASSVAIVASVLLIGGGLKALQTVTILSALPFAILLILTCYSLYKALNDYHETHEKKHFSKRVEQCIKKLNR